MVGRGSKIENLSTEFMDGPNTNNTHQSIIVIEYSMASRRPVLNKTLGLFLISFAYKVIANRRLDFVQGGSTKFRHYIPKSYYLKIYKC